MFKKLSAKKLSLAALASASLICTITVFAGMTPAQAALPDGATAPDFTTKASKGGKIFSFTLKDALKQGPVVLYFYPAAFSSNCTIEAHDFAEATEDYAKLGAHVIGISTDNIATLQKFSVSECRSRFAVAADPQGIISKNYDAVLPAHSNAHKAERTSYVISPAGRILMSYTNNDPDEHVSRTLATLKAFALQNAQKK